MSVNSAVKNRAAPNPVDAEPLSRSSDLAEYSAALGHFASGRWSAERWKTFRLRFGVYSQRLPEAHMVRVKIPGGRLSFSWARTLADAVRDHTGRAGLHLTTRQDAQLYDIPLEETPALLEKLGQGGMTTREAAGNTLRNVTACPLAGFCPHELVDAGAVAQRLTGNWLRHPLVQNMPRKFKTTVSGCEQDCGGSATDDLGLIARADGGRSGFKVVAGGGLGANPRLGVTLLDFVEEHELGAVQEALARLHQAHSDRTRKSRSRIKFLVDRWGEAEFVRRFREAFEAVRGLARRPWEPLRWRRPAANALRIVRPSGRVVQHDGGVALFVSIPLGWIEWPRLRELADVADAAGAFELRLTREQNIAIVGLPVDQEETLLQRIRELGFEVREAASGVCNVTACPGASTCPLGVTDSHALADAVVNDARLVEKPESCIRISGCPNGCGHHNVAEIGLSGLARKVGGRSVPFYRFHFGGRLASGGRVGQEGPATPAANVKEALNAILSRFEAERREGERLGEWAERLGAETMNALLAPHAASAPATDERLFQDWGQSIPFQPPHAGPSANECAAAAATAEHLEDLARDAAWNIDRYERRGENAAALAAARQGAELAGRRLFEAVGETAPDGEADRLFHGIRIRFAEHGPLLEALDRLVSELARASASGEFSPYRQALEEWIDAVAESVEWSLGLNRAWEPIL